MSNEKLIPAEHVDVYWNAHEDLKSGTFEILVIDRRELSGNEELQREAARYSSSAGCHMDSWLASEHPFLKPEGLFINVWTECGADREAMKSALEQFAKIQECEWARTMLAGLKVLEG